MSNKKKQNKKVNNKVQHGYCEESSKNTRPRHIVITRACIPASYAFHAHIKIYVPGPNV